MKVAKCASVLISLRVNPGARRPFPPAAPFFYFLALFTLNVPTFPLGGFFSVETVIISTFVLFSLFLPLFVAFRYEFFELA